MDITAEDVLRLLQDRFCLVGKYDLGLTAAAGDKLLIVFHIVHAGKRVKGIAEVFAVSRLVEHIAVGVYITVFQQLLIKEMIADLIGRIAEHQRDLLHTQGNAAQPDGKAVAAEDGENDAQMVAAELGAYIVGDVLNSGIISCGTGNNRFGDSNDVTVSEGEALSLGGSQYAVADNGYKVIVLADDRRADAPHNSTNSSQFYYLPKRLGFPEVLCYNNHAV